MLNGVYRTYGEMARHLIDQAKYMVIATSDKHCMPWAAPVFFAYDDKFNLYFISAVDSKHAENISRNPYVAVSIFDSSQPIGMSEGIQIEGKTSVVERSKLKGVIDVYSSRLFRNSNIPDTSRYNESEYSGASEFRFFKIEVVQAYVTGVDRRVKVDLTSKNSD